MYRRLSSLRRIPILQKKIRELREKASVRTPLGSADCTVYGTFLHNKAHLEAQFGCQLEIRDGPLCSIRRTLPLGGQSPRLILTFKTFR